MLGFNALVLATFDTKAAEADYLCECLERHDVHAEKVDLGLQSNGVRYSGTEKLAAMDRVVECTINSIEKRIGNDVDVVIALGGGTGGEIAIRVMKALPITFPKVLVSTLPFDPRVVVADSSIVLIPTLADLCGLNATLREVIENAAAISAGLCTSRRQAGSCIEHPSIGITGLGVTSGAVDNLVAAFETLGEESTVFHSNGFGGAALARFAGRGAFKAIVDLTPHELTRIELYGVHVDMPNRFSAGSELPRIVLPGALNFIGLGPKHLMPTEYLARPHYAHSGFFTHAKVTQDEMAMLALQLSNSMNKLSGPAAVVVPMGGFSHQDCKGGQIEDMSLREIFFETMKRNLTPDIRVHAVDAHISDIQTTTTIMDVYQTLLTD